MKWCEYIKGWVIIAIFVIPILFICYLLDNKESEKTTYQKIQDFRHENYYDVLDYDDYLPEYSGDYKTFTEEEIINAYKNGVNDGIEQTIEYFELENN